MEGGWRLSSWLCAIVLLGAACTKRNPAYCSANSDCPGDMRCNLEQSPKNTCVAKGDGGLDGADASHDGTDGGEGGKTGCQGNEDCSADGGGAVCDVDAGMCVGCLFSSDCTGTLAVCDPDTKTCVGCLSKIDCTGTLPACDPTAKQCVGCLSSADCSGSTAVCDTSAETCVECLTTADCSFDAARPICDTTHHTCGKCTTDADCAMKVGADPGVCMAHEDGRCATVAETIFVDATSTTTTCSDATGATGRPDKPFCTMQAALTLLASGTYDLVVVRGTVTAGTQTLSGVAGEISIVGQQSGFLAAAAAPALAMTSGSVYVRDLKVSASAAVGISATGGTLRLEHVSVDQCLKGGILLGGAAFQIHNTTISNSGPGTQGSTTWGGVFVSSLPATGTTQLSLVTIKDNKQVGLTCVGTVQGTGVYLSNNAGGVDVNPSCGITACAPLGATCGAAQ